MTRIKPPMHMEGGLRASANSNVQMNVAGIVDATVTVHGYRTSFPPTATRSPPRQVVRCEVGDGFAPTIQTRPASRIRLGAHFRNRHRCGFRHPRLGLGSRFHPGLSPDRRVSVRPRFLRLVFPSRWTCSNVPSRQAMGRKGWSGRRAQNVGPRQSLSPASV